MEEVMCCRIVYHHVHISTYLCYVIDGEEVGIYLVVASMPDQDEVFRIAGAANIIFNPLSTKKRAVLYLDVDSQLSLSMHTMLSFMLCVVK